jgi:hypothetical protein
MAAGTDCAKAEQEMRMAAAQKASTAQIFRLGFMVFSDFGNRTLPIRIIPVEPGAAQRRTIDCHPDQSLSKMNGL